MDISPIVSGLIGSVLAVFLVGILLRSGKKPPKIDSEGWTHLTNTSGIILMGLLCIPFALAFSLLALTPIVSPENDSAVWFFLVGAPMAAFMGFAVYVILFVAARFRSEGLQYRRLWRWQQIEWSQLRGVVDHAMWGTYIKSDVGRLWIWKYRRGFNELLMELCKHNIRGAKELAASDFASDPMHAVIQQSLLERVWEYREETLYPALFGDKSEGIFVLTSEMFVSQFKSEEIDPRWLTYGVHVYAPTDTRDSWLYVTSGMSNPWDGEVGAYSGVGYEFVLETKGRFDWAIRNLLSMLAFNLLLAKGVYGEKPLIDVGDRVPLHQAIDGSDTSEIRHLLVNETQHFPATHQLERGELEFVHLVGVTSREVDWAKTHSSEALTEKLASLGLGTVTYPARQSVV